MSELGEFMRIHTSKDNRSAFADAFVEEPKPPKVLWTRSAADPEFWRKRVLAKGRIRVSEVIQGACTRKQANSLVETGLFKIVEMSIRKNPNLWPHLTAFYIVLTETGNKPRTENDDE